MIYLVFDFYQEDIHTGNFARTYRHSVNSFTWLSDKHDSFAFAKGADVVDITKLGYGFSFKLSDFYRKEKELVRTTRAANGMIIWADIEAESPKI